MMWKINNNINATYLQKFDTEIIIPIFSLIKDTVTEKEISPNTNLSTEDTDFWRETKFFQYLSSEKRKMFSHIMKKTVSGRKLEDLLHFIVLNYDSQYVEYIYNLYNVQNHSINSLNYDIEQVVINDAFKELFLDFYYDSFFADDFIWNTLTEGSYNRSSFHRNFQKENGMAVCPYCDIDTTVAVSNNQIEHFLPKSKYPLLAMNPFNLISSCSACNKAHEGMGDRTPESPIVSPYSEMIHNSAEFQIDFLSNTITLLNKGDNAHHHYFKFLKLYKRYSDPFVYECVDDSATSLFDTISNYAQPSKVAIDSYINRYKKKKNLTIALRSVVKKYPQYHTFE